MPNETCLMKVTGDVTHAAQSPSELTWKADQKETLISSVIKICVILVFQFHLCFKLHVSCLSSFSAFPAFLGF